MRLRILASLTVLAALSAFPGKVRAQFYSTGEDPSGINWFSSDTQNYRIIFPEGLDSLSRIYAGALEQWRIPVSRSCGFVPNGKFKGKMPVLLHPFTALANGMVRWLPRGMELYTVYEADNPSLLKWEKQLAIHEGRHAAQLQAGRGAAHYLLGELSEGLWVGLYPNIAFLEGDAVVAETGLSCFGRGREADFLAFNRMAFDTGDKRDWYQWRWGSQNKYAPNYYVHGYLTIAGMRHFYGDSLFTKRYLSNTRGFLAAGVLPKTVKQASGKNLRKTWRDLMDSYQGMWAAEDALRRPFSEGDEAVRGERLFYTYSGTSGQWSILSGLAQNPTLVKVCPDGSAGKVRPFSASASKLSSNGKRLYWSESIPNPRWDLAADSRIRYMEPDGKGRKVFNLTKKGRFYNPAAAPDGCVYAVEYPTEGGSALVRFSRDGERTGRVKAPGEIQLVEPVVSGERLFATGLTDEGMGIYAVENGNFVPVVDSRPYKIHQIRGASLPDGDGFLFTSDRDGTDQVYFLSLDGLSLNQLTNEKYGATDPWLSQADTLYYSALTPKGQTLRKASLGDLPVKAADPSGHHTYPVAETLSAQERTLAVEDSTPAEISAPKRYSRATRLFHVHSWTPFYADFDNVSSLAGDEFYEVASLGASAFFQSDLGTSYGQVGYSWHDSHHSGHLRYNYTGLPVAFKLSFDINDRDAFSVERQLFKLQEGAEIVRYHVEQLGKPLLLGSLQAYVPLNFSSGGWRRGLIPSAELTMSNDWYDNRYAVYVIPSGEEEYAIEKPSYRTVGCLNKTFSCLSASVRWYSVLPVPSSRIYPRLGLGLEAGFRSHVFMMGSFAPTFYGYSYGYLPGLMDTHGIKLTALAQFKTKEYAPYYENTVSVRPRGFEGSNVGSIMSRYCPTQAKFTFDYALPFAPVDWSFLGPVAYIRNFEFTPFADFTLLKYPSYLVMKDAGHNLWSVGADLAVHLSNLLWVPYDSRLGVRVARNGGSASTLMKNLGSDAKDWYFGFLFSVDI
ncbi:MAG: hypothetical protein IJK96_04740 [Bacteroidales bacterium]|nr:hypothetical protein [Bacteroidales bacterium]